MSDGDTLLFNGVEFSRLSSGFFGTVYAVSAKVVAKAFEPGYDSHLVELDNGLAANRVNSLMPQYLGTVEDSSTALVLMERLYPLQARALSIKERETFLDTFLQQVEELHIMGITHGDIKRPNETWDNIILTKDGIRLIDAGSMGDDYNTLSFEMNKAKDLRDVAAYATWLLNQP